MAITVAQFRERIDKQVLAQLSDSDGDLEDVVKLGHALTDAAAQIQGYLYKVPEVDRPPEATLDAYQVALALYVLTGNRPGAEFDSIRARATAAVKYLDGFSARSPRVPIETETDSPTPQVGTSDLDLFQGKVTE